MFHANEEYCNENEEIHLLLKKWNLSQLEEIFKEHEISIHSLCWLTSEDISELVPKIGPRAIFRAHLLEWQKHNRYNRSKTLNNIDHNNKNPSVQNPIIIKTEPDFDEENLESADTPQPDQRTEYENHTSLRNGSETPPSVGLAEDLPSFMTTACENDIHEFKGPKHDQFLKEQQQQERKTRTHLTLDINPNLDIRSALMNQPEGRAALRYYEENRKLDFKYRRIITAIVINLAVDKKIWLGCKEFQRMANEIHQIFPNESSLTYYMPRIGIQSPRGALYNKYLNMSRKLRLEGRLEYRRNRSVASISFKKSRFSE